MPKKDPVAAENLRKRPPRLFVLIGTTLLAFAGFEWYGSYRSPDAILPERPEGMGATVAALIQREIEAVNRDRSNPERHGRLGVAYEANDMYVEALACFELAARLDAADPVWPYHAATSVLANGQLEAAMERLREITAAHPRFAPGQQRLGIVLLNAGAFDEAERAFRQAATLRPDGPEGFVGLAQVALAGNEYARALTQLEKALALDPGYEMTRFLLGQAYRGLGRMDEAERELTLGTDATTRYIPDRMTQDLLHLVGGLSSQLSRGGALIEAGRAAEAMLVLEAALRDRPNDIDVLNNLAVACIEAKSYPRAVELLLRIRQADESAFPTYINLAACLLRMGHAGEALPHAERAVSLAPHVGQAHFVLGQSLRALGQPAEAIAVLERAVELDRQNPMISLELAEACLMVDRLPEARTHLETVTRQAPTALLGHIKLGAVCLRLRDVEAAERSLARAQTLKADDARVLSLAREVARVRSR